MVRSSVGRALGAAIVAGAVGGLWGAGTPAASACTGEPVSVAWLADHAADVIVCDIDAIEAHWADNPRRIVSEVTLSHIDYLKGRPDPARATMTLTFPGGTVGDTTMRLCCTPDLAVGQRWLIFLQPEYRTYPAAGMGQGIFEVRADADGTPRIFAPGGRPVTAIDAQGIPISQAPTAPTRNAPTPVGTRGHVRLHVDDPSERAAAPAPVAMTLTDFVEQITPVVEASHAFDPAGPVGRYIPTELTAAPLVLAPQAAHQPAHPRPAHAEDVPRATVPAPAPASEGATR